MATSVAAAAIKSIAGHDSGLAHAVNRLPTTFTNVSSTERWVSAAAGGGLIALGLTGRLPGILALVGGGYLIYRAASGHCPVYQAMGVSMSDATAPNSAIAAGHGTRVEEVVTVMRPVDEVYRFWRDFENLPRFMSHLVDVDTTTDGQSRWRAKGPLGLTVEWEAKIIRDERNKVISWQSLPGADVDTAGSVHFRELPGNQTEVRVNLKYDPPAGKLGTMVAKLFGEEPQQQVRDDLQRLRRVMEGGPSV